jgi:hypothetical protein
MSSCNRTTVLSDEDSSNNSGGKKRKRNNSGRSASGVENRCKDKYKENMTDTANERKANFSALNSPNGVTRSNTPVVNSKPGTAKKLVIQNFKGY